MLNSKPGNLSNTRRGCITFVRSLMSYGQFIAAHRRTSLREIDAWIGAVNEFEEILCLFVRAAPNNVNGTPGRQAMANRRSLEQVMIRTAPLSRLWRAAAVRARFAMRAVCTAALA